MTLDQSTLYNKFHILSIGLRKIDNLMSHKEIDKAKIIIDRLIKASDEGMEKIKDMDLGWEEG